jgi:hypothetical protein
MELRKSDQWRIFDLSGRVFGSNFRPVRLLGGHRITKSLDLLILNDQICDGVAQQVDEAKRSVDLRCREVTDGDVDVRRVVLGG